MTGFAAAYLTGIVWIGFIGGFFLTGAIAGLLISFSSISLKQSQVAGWFYPVVIIP